MKKRDTELSALFKRLYEDNVLGRTPDEHFKMLSEEYTTEQKEKAFHSQKKKCKSLEILSPM